MNIIILLWKCGKELAKKKGKRDKDRWGEERNQGKETWIEWSDRGEESKKERERSVKRAKNV